MRYFIYIISKVPAHILKKKRKKTAKTNRTFEGTGTFIKGYSYTSVSSPHKLTLARKYKNMQDVLGIICHNTNSQKHFDIYEGKEVA